MKIINKYTGEEIGKISFTKESFDFDVKEKTVYDILENIQKNGLFILADGKTLFEKSENLGQIDKKRFIKINKSNKILLIRKVFFKNHVLKL